MVVSAVDVGSTLLYLSVMEETPASLSSTSVRQFGSMVVRLFLIMVIVATRSVCVAAIVTLVVTTRQLMVWTMLVWARISNIS